MENRVNQCIKQLFIWVPLAAVINLLALGPILLFYNNFIIGGGKSISDFTIVFLGAGFMWGVTFGVNKLKFYLKGRETDDEYIVEYEKVTYTLYRKTNYYEIQENRERFTRSEFELSGWGLLAFLSSFIALPLQLIALLMSYLSLIFPFIYSSAKYIPGRLSLFNQITHSLFDFVLIPYIPNIQVEYPHILGLAWLPAYLAVPAAGGGLSYLFAYVVRLIVKPGGLHYVAVVVTIVGVLILVFAVSQAIKGAIDVICNYSLEDALEVLCVKVLIPSSVGAMVLSIGLVFLETKAF